jgi:hypothetical protein
MSGRTRKIHGRGFPQPDNYLKNAEMDLEDNYNQIDGMINNQKSRCDLTDGQSYDDLRELATETLPEEKRSVLERLEQAREQARAAEPEDSCPSMER